jgi:Anaerobic dehydrogenases, typically selenocysteine-containing
VSDGAKETKNLSRRSFLTKCGVAVVATAACELLSVFSGPAAEAGVNSLCTACDSWCVTSCTSNTCVNNKPPEPSPPKCVKNF